MLLRLFSFMRVVLSVCGEQRPSKETYSFFSSGEDKPWQFHIPGVSKCKSVSTVSPPVVPSLALRIKVALSFIPFFLVKKLRHPDVIKNAPNSERATFSPPSCQVEAVLLWSTITISPDCSFVRSFAHIAHSFASYTLSAGLICSLACSLAHSLAE